MNTNQPLQQAKAAKKDEFYTQLSDIENELKHYKKHFVGKTVYCNCDDPKASNFFQYFYLNFEYLGLKKLITTCYKSQETDLFSRHDAESGVKLEYTGRQGHQEAAQNDNIIIRPLTGDGDFRSSECVDLLKEADVVVTNPPFSLFREFVGQLVSNRKNFLIIGHQNAITYREIFPLVKDDRIWLGYGFPGGAGYFITNYNDYAAAGQHKEGMVRVSGVHWFTNLDIDKRHEEIVLAKTYSPEEYPTYDNFDAIEVSRVAEIPKDYSGMMGVPLTFMNKYNPDQFEILGQCYRMVREKTGVARYFYVGGRKKYDRIVIRNRQLSAWI